MKHLAASPVLIAMQHRFRLHRHEWGWLLANAAITGLFSPILYDLGRLALQKETYSHIGLVPWIYLWLMFRLRRSLPPAEPGSGRRSAVILTAAAAAALAGWAFLTSLTPIDRLSVAILGLVAALWAVSLLSFGPNGFRASLFPQLFLLFLVPVPQELLDLLIEALLWGSSVVTELLFRLTGVPHLQEGAVFVLPGLSIEIARECSGIRSTMALVITALLAGHLALSSLGARLGLVLALFPLAVFKNGLRIATLSLLAIHVDPGFIEGDLHRKGGLVFFCLTLAVMAGLVWILQRMERRLT